MDINSIINKMGILTGSYVEYTDETSGGYLVVDNLDLYVSQSAYITENLYVTGTIYGTTTTASYVNPLTQSVSILGNLIVNGNISASVLNVSVVTSSVTVYTGSTVFGSSSSDIHQFTGSIKTTGSIHVTGSVYGNLIGSSSYALTSSYNLSSSYALTASYALNAAGFSSTGSFTGSFTGSVRTNDIQVIQTGGSSTRNYVTQSSVLNNTSSIIWYALDPNIPSAFINYYASDLGSGGNFFQVGTLYIGTNGINTTFSEQNTPSLGAGTIIFSSSLGSSLELYASINGMNTQCDFVLDVKTLL